MPKRGETTIDRAEVEQFSKLAAQWWDERGPMAMLHKFNPVRLAYIRDQVATHFGRNPRQIGCLSGLRILDIGCGGGILSEPLARLGANVIGADPAEANIAVARKHAALTDLVIDYRAVTAEALADKNEKFDVVLAMEVVEHVADVPAFIAGLAEALAPDGLLILSTPNRTAWSKLVMIGIGEGTGRIPRGTHHWDQFLTPEDLSTQLREAGLAVVDTTGLSFSLTRGFRLSDDMSLNYLVTATRA